MDEGREKDVNKERESRVALQCPNCGKPALISAIDKNYGICPHCGNKFRLFKMPK